MWAREGVDREKTSCCDPSGLEEEVSLDGEVVLRHVREDNRVEEVWRLLAVPRLWRQAPRLDCLQASTEHCVLATPRAHDRLFASEDSCALSVGA